LIDRKMRLIVVTGLCLVFVGIYTVLLQDYVLHLFSLAPPYAYPLEIYGASAALFGLLVLAYGFATAKN
jgi:hypothetical protein